MGILFTVHMGILFTITMGILLTITMGFLFTIVLGIQFTISNWALTSLEDNFDLVLTDLGMSEMSGWQLAKKIKGMDPDVPVGLITGWTVATTKEKMKERGVDFILSKPFDYTKVVREVNAVLKSKSR